MIAAKSRTISLACAGAISLALVGAAMAPAPSFGSEQKDTFVIATRLTDSKFDPALHSAEFDAVDIVNLYEPLFYPSPGKPPVPALAESASVSADGLVWTIKLGGKGKFHDGKPVTAKDVAYSMDRMLTINKGYAYLWAGLLKPGSTKAVDDQTVTFTLEKPFGPFIDTLVQFFIVNSELVKANTKPQGAFGANGDFGTEFLTRNDAGSGPYKLEAVVPDTRRSYVRFSDYPGGWKPNQYQRVVVQIVGETATARGLLLGNKIDFVDQWQPVEFYSGLRREAKVDIVESVDAKLYVMQMNNQRPPFDDINFRKAVLHAFDYKTAIEAVMGGAEKANGPIPSRIAGYDASIPGYSFDLAKAKEFLAKSKYRPDQHELVYAYLKAGVHEQMGLLLQANLQHIGIKVKLQPEQWPTLTKWATLPDTTPHFFPVYNTAKYPSADAYTFGMYHPGSHGSWGAASWYANAAAHKLIDEARGTGDAEKRNRLYAEAARRISDDAASIWVAYAYHRIAKSKDVENYAHVGIMAFDLNVYRLTFK